MDTPQHEAGEHATNSASRQLDIAARAIGLRKRLAYLPIEEKKTGNAARVKRSKARAAAEGIKQITVSLPREHHDVFKAIAAELKAGRAIEEVLVSTAHLEKYERSGPTHVGDLRRSIRSLGRAMKSIFIAASAVIRSFARRALRNAGKAYRLKSAAPVDHTA